MPMPYLAEARMALEQSMPTVCSISCLTRSGSAAGRSILLSTGMISRSFSTASHTLANVWASTPWLASTTKIAASHAARDRDTSYPKSTCPGVSMRLRLYNCPSLAVYFILAVFSLIVIPRSLSKSMPSRN